MNWDIQTLPLQHTHVGSSCIVTVFLCISTICV